LYYVIYITASGAPTSPEIYILPETLHRMDQEIPVNSRILLDGSRNQDTRRYRCTRNQPNCSHKEKAKHKVRRAMHQSNKFFEERETVGRTV
jgi:hypothetical protein